MASHNTIPVPLEIQSELRKFSDYLYVNHSLEESTMQNYMGTISRMLRETGVGATKDQICAYYADRRRNGISLRLRHIHDCSD